MEYTGAPTSQWKPRFFGVPREIEDLTNELNSLGGGDARMGEAQVFCRIAPRLRQDTRIAWSEGSQVCVRDPSVCDASSSNIQRFTVTQSVCCTENEEENLTFENLGHPAVNWVWEGFNACIIANGASRTGKTRAMFGGWNGRSFVEDGLLYRCCSDLFDRIAIDPMASLITVGISCWEVHNQQVVDLLDKENPQKTFQAENAVTVRIENLRQCRQVLRFAHSRSVNWTKISLNQASVGIDSPYVALRNKAHAFVRIVLYHAGEKSVSTLHFVDLIGFKK